MLAQKLLVISRFKQQYEILILSVSTISPNISQTIHFSI